MIKSLIHSMIVCPNMDKQYPKISYGEGVYIYDETGKSYIDGSSGSAGVSNIGHGIKDIAKIISDQVLKISVLPTHAFSSEVVETYLEKLVGFAPEGFARAWTVTSGTEAVENAIKLAFQYHQLNGEKDRFKVIGRWNSYHGNSIFTLDVGGMKMRRDTYAKWMNNYPHLSPAYKYRKADDISDIEYSNSLVQEFRNMILAEGPQTISSLVLEPVVAAALGAVPPPHPSYFQKMKEVCDEFGILMISDEILTGFGRLGQNFGISNWDVTPDIIATGKGISGGYFPLSAVIASEKVSRVFENNKSPFLGGHTFACNPVGCAVGNFVIDYMEKNQINQNATKIGEYLNSRLKELLDISIVGDIRGVGMLQGIELVQDKILKTAFPQELQLSKKIGEMCIEKGVILYPGRGSVDGKLGDHIMLCPPLISERKHIDKIVDVLKESIIEVI